MDSNYECKIEEIVETLKWGKENGGGCTLLVGAGCSVTANIPTAHGFVEEIRKKKPYAYDQANPKNYPQCMEKLHPEERNEIISKYIDKAKINWAHMCIGLLIQEGYVDRVLTVNFDPLVARACALLGEFPAIYDFGKSQHFKSERIPDKAIFHLHGQHTGFVLLHTEKDVNGHVKTLKPVFEDAGRNRTWIVVGYSGENDPVFKHLEKVKEFSRGLYWIGHEDKEPAAHVRKGLLNTKKRAFYTKGYHADSFFIKLTQELEVFPPKFVTHPFTHLHDTFKDLEPFVLPEQSEDILKTTRVQIEAAIETYEEGHEKHTAEANRLMMAGKNDEVIASYKNYDLDVFPNLKELLTWAYTGQGISLSGQAKAKTGEKADELLTQAGEKYQEALNIKPENHHALNNLGNVLADQAKTKTGNEADTLFAQAGEKYQQALKIKPDLYEAFNNWGIVLEVQAQTKTGEEADELFAQAREKYQQALKIKPDLHVVFDNLGIALDAQANTKTGDEADELFAQAREKFQEALRIKPDEYKALFHWGNTNYWQAMTKTGLEADELFAQAREKYQEALKIKPDLHEALTHWGVSFNNQAKTKTGNEADDFFAQAKEKYQEALKIKPDYGSAIFNMACLAALTGDEKGCREWLEKRIELGPLAGWESMSDSDFDSVRELDWFKKLVAETKKKKG